MRLIFMGTPDFATPTLAALAAAGHDIVAVYTQPPRPAGRGKRPRPSPVQTLAEILGAPVRTPENFRSPEIRAAFAALKADAAVVVAYGQLLPQEVLDAPRYGCFNLHASLLPRWRGAAPIQRALMAGDAETGVAVMRMALALDAGPVLATASTPIGASDSAGDLHDRLAALGAPLMAACLEAIEHGSASETPQPDEGVTYAAKIEKSEAAIDWRAPAAEVDRQIRGLSPFPGAWTAFPAPSGESERVKILMCAVETAPRGGDPGVFLDDALLIACGDATAVGAPALRVLTIQRAGRGPVSADAFLRGFPCPAGARVGAEAGGEDGVRS